MNICIAVARKPNPVRLSMVGLLLCACAPSAIAAGVQPVVVKRAHPHAAAKAALKPSAPEEISVDGSASHQAGGGLMTEQTQPISQSTVNQVFLSKQSPTMNAYQAIELTPGANVSSGDPYGIGNNQTITIRGLAGNQVGQLWEGMPVNDIEAYGGYPSYWSDSEDVGSVSLVPGSTDIDTPVITSAGGYTSVKFKDPSEKSGGMADFTYGNHNTERVYVRAESGLIGNSGVRMFLSYSHMNTNNTYGAGRNGRQHADFKALKEWGKGNRVSLSASFSDMTIIDNIRPTLGEWDALGRGNRRDGTYTFGDTNYYKLNRAPWRQVLVSAPSHFVLSDRWTADITPYFLYAMGNSPGGSTLSTTGNYYGTQPVTLSVPNAVNGTGTVLADYDSLQRAGGVNASSKIELSRINTFEFGAWYQYSLDNESIPYSAVRANGSPYSLWASNDILTTTGQKYYTQNDHTVTQIATLYASDTFHLLNNKLDISAGFRAQMINRAGTNGLPGPQYHVGGNYFIPMPRVTLKYQINKQSFIFANGMTSSITPTDDTLYSSYSGTSVAGVAQPNLKPQYTISEEIGYRYYGNIFHGGLTFFNYNMTNRQMSTTIVEGGGAVVSSSINAGGETSRGVEAELALAPFHHFSPYVSFSYLNARTNNNLRYGNDYLHTAGKVAPEAPRFMGAFGLTYDDGKFFGSFTFKYTGSQYSTFMNDEKMPSYTSENVSVGYRFHDFGLMKRPELRVNLVNMLDRSYLSGIASPTLNARDTVGVYGTTISGNSPTYWMGPVMGVMVTGTSSF